MIMRYIYPENLTAAAVLWLWRLKDFAILAIAVLLGIVAWAQLGTPVLMAAAFVFAFLTVRCGDVTILDFLVNCVRYFISSQQTFFWRLDDE